MGVFGRGDRTRPWSLAARYGVPLVAVAMIVVSLIGIRGSVRAWTGDGTPGTFTAKWPDCRGNDCSWTGDFTSVDGRVHKSHVALYDGRGHRDMRKGGTRPALDTGNPMRVYGPGGYKDVPGYELLMLLSGLGALFYAGKAWRGRPRRRPGIAAAPAPRPSGRS
ncbi:hypothetical protein GCM10010191_19160 [Actinomadura vinacea]|uniref:Cell wall protein n=1 Tax=Actinomadura vinacea TaxID=115336 RepID=A0ABP5VSZ0_9ACTN